MNFNSFFCKCLNKCLQNLNVKKEMNIEKKTCVYITTKKTTYLAEYFKKININKCTICLMKIKNKDLFITNCAHKFHIECICKWCDINNICPICRFKCPIIEKNLDEYINYF